jgi:O-glycosyl hydrolase
MNRISTSDYSCKVYVAAGIKIGVVLFCMALVSGPTDAGAVDITVDHTVKYQTVVGFGGQAGAGSQQAAEMVQDVGFSVVRVDWCGSAGSMWDAKPWLDAGLRTVVGSCWSPPANMKTNNSLSNGGNLKPESYDAFANHAISTLKQFKNSYQVEMYGLSPQNEPDFPQFYSSCVYTEGKDLLDITKRIGVKIKAEGLSTRLFYHEDMYGAFFGKYFKALVDDRSALEYIQALAFHGYTADGVTPAQMQAGYLGRMHQAINNFGTGLWQTENAGSMGLGYASDVIGCLRYGKVSMYLKYGLTGNSVGMVGSPMEFLYYQGQKTLTYYVCKTIAKFIRPGAVQLRTISSDSTQFNSFVAFHDKTAGALVITLATGNDARTVTIKGTNMPSSFDTWVTNASTNCVNQGKVSASNIALAANSVITLYGAGYTLPVSTPVVATSRQTGHCARPGQHVAFYTIQGRRIHPFKTGPGQQEKTNGILIKNGTTPQYLLQQ